MKPINFPLAALAWAALCCGAPSLQAASQPTPGELSRTVGIDQNLGASISLNTQVRDENGRLQPLSQFFRGKPVIVNLVYYECPMLCTEVLNGLVRSLRVLKFVAGPDFEIVTLSFNPKEGPDLARQKKEQYLKAYGRPEAAASWHFLTAEPDAIAQVARELGFHYAPVAGTPDFAHASGLFLLTAEGRIPRVFYGVDYPAKDLRLGLVEASHRQIGSPVDKLLLLCYHYDPLTGRYGLAIDRSLKLAGSATVLVLAVYVTSMLWRERSGRAA